MFLTANADTVYFWVNFDATKGPLVFESPPLALGVIDDIWFRWVTDFGLPGPDRGEGGRYLPVPPGYKGELPESGYTVCKLRTFRATALGRRPGKKGPEACGGHDQENAQGVSVPSRWLRHEHRLRAGRRRHAARAPRITS